MIFASVRDVAHERLQYPRSPGPALPNGMKYRDGDEARFALSGRSHGIDSDIAPGYAHYRLCWSLGRFSIVGGIPHSLYSTLNWLS